MRLGVIPALTFISSRVPTLTWSIRSDGVHSTEGSTMSDKIKRALAALAALGALALGGAAIAGATGGGSGSDQATAENEQADGSEAGEAGNAADDQGGDGDGELSAA